MVLKHLGVQCIFFHVCPCQLEDDHFLLQKKKNKPYCISVNRKTDGFFNSKNYNEYNVEKR